MGVPTGAGNYPPGVTDNDPHFDREDELDDYGEEWACTWCGGEGESDDLDPLQDDCDERGYGPCPACRGTGLRKNQTVF